LVSLEALKETSQHSLFLAIDLKVHEEMMAQDLDTRTRALNSVNQPHSGDWLNALPSSYLGLSLHSQEFRLAAKYRLGAPVYDEASTCPMDRCTRPNDVYGNHVYAISCATDGVRIFRHDRLRDAIFLAAQGAGLCPRREVRHLFPDTDDRPGDIFIDIWQRGRGAAFDVTVTSPLQQSQVSRVAAQAGAAVEAAKKRKLDRYATRCHEAGIYFIPLAVDTLGGWDCPTSGNHEKWRKEDGQGLKDNNPSFLSKAKHCATEGKLNPSCW
jgi:hypothetical protein